MDGRQLQWRGFMRCCYMNIRELPEHRLSNLLTLAKNVPLTILVIWGGFYASVREQTRDSYNMNEQWTLHLQNHIKLRKY